MTVTEEIKKKNPRNKWCDNSKHRCSKSSTQREVYSNKVLTQEIRKTSNKQLKFTPETTEKKKKKKNDNNKAPKIRKRRDKIQSRHKWNINEGNSSKD